MARLKKDTPTGEAVETVVVLRNMGTADHVRLCAEPDRASARVALVKAGERITYNSQIVRGAALGEWGDEWVHVQQVETGLNGYIHRAYLLLPGDPPLEAAE